MSQRYLSVLVQADQPCGPLDLMRIGRPRSDDTLLGYASNLRHRKQIRWCKDKRGEELTRARVPTRSGDGVVDGDGCGASRC
jgi:hypothetical protein